MHTWKEKTREGRYEERDVGFCGNGPIRLGMLRTAAGGPDPSPTAKKDAPNVVFYTFPDIPVPRELSFQREKSFVYETPTVKAGVLVLTGNVDVSPSRPTSGPTWRRTGGAS